MIAPTTASCVLPDCATTCGSFYPKALTVKRCGPASGQVTQPSAIPGYVCRSRAWCSVTNISYTRTRTHTHTHTHAHTDNNNHKNHNNNHNNNTPAREQKKAEKKKL